MTKLLCCNAWHRMCHNFIGIEFKSQLKTENFVYVAHKSRGLFTSNTTKIDGAKKSEHSSCSLVALKLFGIQGNNTFLLQYIFPDDRIQAIRKKMHIHPRNIASLKCNSKRIKKQNILQLIYHGTYGNDNKNSCALANYDWSTDKSNKISFVLHAA